MAEERKSILLRIPPELWEEINRQAQRELRSTNAQIEFLIREALARRGVRDDDRAPPNADRTGPAPTPDPRA